VSEIPYIVTAGLDPAVHADWPNVRRGLMDCRIKSGNDEAFDHVMPALCRACSLRQRIFSRVKFVLCRLALSGPANSMNRIEETPVFQSLTGGLQGNFLAA
jgi:hypothetical protein